MVVAGVDRGLRVGGACVHRPSSRRAVVLGMLKQGLSSVRLQWDDGDAAVRSVAGLFLATKHRRKPVNIAGHWP